MYAARFADKPLKILTDITGLVEWVDYLPVKAVSSGVANTYDAGGYLTSTSQSANPSGTAWLDFTPVYVVSRNTPWSTESDGFIPFNDVTV